MPGRFQGLSFYYVLTVVYLKHLASQANVLETAGMFARENNKSSLVRAKFPIEKKNTHVVAHYK